MANEQTPKTEQKNEIKPTEAVAPKPTISNLPAVLQPIKDCFVLPQKAFLAAFSDPEEGKVRFAKEINFAKQSLMNNPYLIQCAANNPNNLVDAIINVALTRSTLNPALKLAYLVPFKGKITLMPSYMGLIDTLINSGLVTKVEAHPVFKGEQFEMVHGSNGYIKHIPDAWGSKTKDNLLGCYYYIKLADGGELFDALSKEEIEAVKQRSASVSQGKSSPWDTDYIEMAKKTAIRRGWKACPKTGISEDKLKVVEAAFNYEDKAEEEWVRSQPKFKDDGFDEEADYEDISTN